jgi:putative aldouronate transport system permease protein
MDQYLVFENSTNTTDIMVLDLYVYKMGIVNGAIPFSTAVGMLKSVVSVILLFTANNVSKLIRGETIV